MPTLNPTLHPTPSKLMLNLPPRHCFPRILTEPPSLAPPLRHFPLSLALANTLPPAFHTLNSELHLFPYQKSNIPNHTHPPSISASLNPSASQQIHTTTPFLPLCQPKPVPHFLSTNTTTTNNYKLLPLTHSPYQARNNEKNRK